MRSVLLRLAFAFVTVALLSGCGRDVPLSPRGLDAGLAVGATSSDARFPLATSTGPVHLEGEIGPGALYAIDVPPNWNHDLVLYAHGLVSPSLPIALPSGEGAAFRAALLQRGYAVAFSSYSQNGLAIDDGSRRTEQLRGLFVSRIGAPSHTFLLGVSMGGAVALQLIEQHPEQYDGGLLLSGLIGGTRTQLQYDGNVFVLFDYFFPGVLVGRLDQPTTTDFRQLIPAVVGAIQAHPERAGALAAILHIPFHDGNELVLSIAQALGLNYIELNDILKRTHGHSFFDNHDVVYSGPLPPELLADLNAHVTRYTATPDAIEALRHAYQPSGRLLVPLVTLHDSRDPVVPQFEEGNYHDAVAAAGHSDLLVQRTDDAFGHVVFSAAEVGAAFDELVAWSKGGPKPAP